MIADRYVPLRRIASGGTATVYCAEDLVLRRVAALKMLHDHLADDVKSVERLRREASTAAAIHHPNIVSVYEFGEWQGRHYLAMEYARGRSLRSLMREGPPLPPARAINLTLQLLLATRCVHQHGFVHCDLKPENVVIDDDGRLKLADFGIAQPLHAGLMRTGDVIGTVRYMSPEQAVGDEVSGASDLYSIGIILYELLTDQVPFEGDTIQAVVVKQLMQRPTRPSAVNAAVTRALDAVVMRALESKPTSRFVDAGTFIAALLSAESEPTAHRFIGPHERRPRLGIVNRFEPQAETMPLNGLARRRIRGFSVPRPRSPRRYEAVGDLAA